MIYKNVLYNIRKTFREVFEYFRERLDMKQFNLILYSHITLYSDNNVQLVDIDKKFA